ncbi:hypothetical protein CJ030_MR6G004338 [Morella rubra]|uniref:Uncharacterized protein n=1 Tax=Morella rubra TaxID=262757 RepID=A0A6A1VB35_9ROSI|nr:hypothetical protein CJ030_MR6G004338 [Morella rubra]
MTDWSAGFYSGIDTLVKVAKEKFSDVDLTILKAEDYADQAGSEVSSPMAEEGPNLEVGVVPLGVVAEEGVTSGANVVALPLNSPFPIPEISLAYPVAMDLSLVSIDQAVLSLIVIAREVT